MSFQYQILERQQQLHSKQPIGDLKVSATTSASSAAEKSEDGTAVGDVKIDPLRTYKLVADTLDPTGRAMES